MPPSDTTIPATGAPGLSWVADLDGDGRTDILYAVDNALANQADQVYWRRNNGAGFDAAAVWYDTHQSSWSNFGTATPFGSSQTRFRSPIRLGDFDGDGATDLLVFLRTDLNEDEGGLPELVWRWMAIIDGAEAGGFSDSGSSGSAIDPLLTDVNADGCVDVLYAATTGFWKVVRSRCSDSLTPFSAGASTGIANGATGHAMILDWDSDGRDDLLLPSGSIWFWYRSVGSSYASGVSTGISYSSSGSAVAFRAADVNGDGLNDFLESNTSLKVRLHPGARPDLVTTITDGYSNTVTFNYNTINGASACYARDSSAPAFPARVLLGAVNVVCSVTASNGIGGTYTLTNTYYNADVHLQGRGFLGFDRMHTVDSRDGIIHRTTFRKDFPYTGMVTLAESRQPGDTQNISQLTNVLSTLTAGSGFQTRHFPFVSQSTSKRWEVGGIYNGVQLTQAVTAISVDSFGTAYDVTTTTTELSGANGVNSAAQYTQRVYHPTANLVNDTTYWCLGRPGQTQFINSHTQFGGSTLTRTVNRTFDAIKCRPTQEVLEPGNGQLQVTTDLIYDDAVGESDPDNGNLTRVTVTGIGMSARSSQISFGSMGTLPVSTTNALGQATQLAWNFSTITRMGYCCGRRTSTRRAPCSGRRMQPMPEGLSSTNRSVPVSRRSAATIR